MTIMQQTALKVTLSVNVVSENEHGAILRTLNLVSLTALIMLVWNCRLLVNQIRYAVYRFEQDLLTAISITCKVLAIGFNSLCFGMNVRYV